MAADERVNRFLSWRLPDDFAPDCGISFKPITNPAWTHDLWPSGTNLFHAGQAKAMFEHCIPLCTWTLDDDECCTWRSECGASWCFEDGGPEDNSCRYCHNCGGALVIVRPEPEADDDDDAV